MASGGAPPYSYKLVSGAGTLNGNVYSAPANAETVDITVADSRGGLYQLKFSVLGIAKSALSDLEHFSLLGSQASCPAGYLSNGNKWGDLCQDNSRHSTLACQNTFCVQRSNSPSIVSDIQIKNYPNVTCDQGYQPMKYAGANNTHMSYGPISVICIKMDSSSKVSNPVTNFYFVDLNSSCPSGDTQTRGSVLSDVYGAGYTAVNFCVAR